MKHRAQEPKRDQKARVVTGLTSLANSYVPSDSGPWRTYSDDRDAHVVPGFEKRRHVLHALCHCHPTLELDEESGLIMYLHQAAQ